MELGFPHGASKPVRIEQVPLARLVFALLHQRFTGTVQLEQPEPAGARTVWLSGGMPVFTDWISPVHPLGEVLVAEGVIRPEDLSLALRVMSQEGGRLGPVLLGLGVVDEARLGVGLARQCARKLVETFALREGELVVTTGPFEGPEMVKVNALELIASGVMTHYDTARVEAEMGEALHGLMVSTGALARYAPHFKLGRDDEPLLAALTTGTRFDELVRLPGITRRRAAQVVFTLWVCQMLRVGAAAMVIDPPRRPTPSAVPPTDGPPRRPSPPPAPAAAPRARAMTPTPVPPVEPPSAEIEPPRQSNQEFIAELEDFEHRISDRVHAFALLGIDLDAGKREVRRAFGELSRRFHPDAMQSRGLGELRERVGQVFAALSEAQMLLADQEKRDNLRVAIEKGVSIEDATDATAMARAAFESEVLAREGDKLLKVGRFDRALEQFDEALALAPDEPDLRAAACWCRYNLSQHGREDAMTAEQILKEITGEYPNIARAHYFYGLVLKDLGAIDPAIDSLTRAAQLDPRLVDAERQARALRISRPKRGAAAGDKNRGLRGLFGGAPKPPPKKDPRKR
jgi:tetratricopeptide (TPR) repeat protein